MINLRRTRASHLTPESTMAKLAQRQSILSTRFLAAWTHLSRNPHLPLTTSSMETTRESLTSALPLSFHRRLWNSKLLLFLFLLSLPSTSRLPTKERLRQRLLQHQPEVCLQLLTIYRHQRLLFQRQSEMQRHPELRQPRVQHHASLRNLPSNVAFLSRSSLSSSVPLSEYLL